MFEEHLSRVECTQEFQDFKNSHTQAFLSSIFIQDDDVQLGYYDPENNKISTFFLKKEGVQLLSDQEILETGKEVERLNLGEVKISSEQALEFAKKSFEESIVKTFLVVQTISENTIYNITFFTQVQKIINVRVSASTGEVLSSNTTNLKDFYKKV